MVRVSPRPFRDLFGTQFPHKMHFLSYLNLKTTSNFVHVQSQVCRFYYDSLIISAEVWGLGNGLDYNTAAWLNKKPTYDKKLDTFFGLRHDITCT